MFQSCKVAMLHSCIVKMLQCCNVAYLQNCKTAMLQWCNVAMLQCCNVTMLQHCNVAMLQTSKYIWKHKLGTDGRTNGRMDERMKGQVGFLSSWAAVAAKNWSNWRCSSRISSQWVVQEVIMHLYWSAWHCITILVALQETLVENVQPGKTFDKIWVPSPSKIWLSVVFKVGINRELNPWL